MFKVDLVKTFNTLKNFGSKKELTDKNIKTIVIWKEAVTRVEKDKNFIEFLDHRGELWYQTFTFKLNQVDTIRDEEHELKLLHLVAHEFSLYQQRKIGFFSQLGYYVSVKGLVGSSNEVWSIQSVQHRYSMFPLQKLYQDVIN